MYRFLVKRRRTKTRHFDMPPNGGRGKNWFAHLMKPRGEDRYQEH